MSRATDTKGLAAAVAAAAKAHDQAREAEAQHLASLAEARERVESLYVDSRETTAGELAEAEAEVKRLEAASVHFTADAAEAAAELRYALSAELSGSLSGKFDPSGLTDKLSSLEAKAAKIAADMATAIEAWNAQVRDAVAQCSAAGLVEGQADPFAAALVDGDGRLRVDGQVLTTYSATATVRTRFARAAGVEAQ